MNEYWYPVHYHKYEIRQLKRQLKEAWLRGTSEEYYAIMRKIGEHRAAIIALQRARPQYRLFFQR